MGVALLGEHKFRLDPSSIQWNFTIKTNAFETVGGRVVQVYGTDTGDMQIEGSFGRGGYVEQKAFLEEMRKIGLAQAANAKAKTAVNPLRFLYPPKGWDFLVYLKEYRQPGGNNSVMVEPHLVDIPWSLRLFIVEDNADLTRIVVDNYIARMSIGLGWKQTTFNGGNPS